jgi:glycosyl transferase, family 25
MLFDRFDRIRIVNLPHRKDRRNEMNRQLAKVGLLGDPRVEYFAAVSPVHPWIFTCNGAHGCFESHRRILIKAMDAGESVLILEDDCNFRLPEIFEYELPECDVFYGGYHSDNPDDLEYSNIIGSHFMGFSARAAQMAADYLWSYVKPDFEPAPAIAAPRNLVPRPGIDGAYVWFRRTYPQLVTVFADLSYQRPSRTDIGEQKWFDRVPVLRELATFARRFKKPRSDGVVF